jgi:hypothetical protein
MSGLRPYEASLAILETAASAGLLIRLLSSGLYRSYRFFCVYLILICVQGIFPFFVSSRTNAYGWWFCATEGFIVCLYALIVLELYSLVLRDLPGIASVARRYIRIAIVIAIVLSALLLGLERPPGQGDSRQSWIAGFFIFERPVVSSLVCFVLLLTAFLAYYPIRLNRNVIYYTIGYAFYFTSKGVALFLRNTGHEWNEILSPAMLGISTACLLFWTFALKSTQEQHTQVVRHRWSRDEEQRLLKQLDAVNASLLRARK